MGSHFWAAMVGVAIVLYVVFSLNDIKREIAALRGQVNAIDHRLNNR
jgi:hypothetical protein